MAIYSRFNLFCFVILTVSAQVCVSRVLDLPASREPPIEATVCPDAASIAPCVCMYYDSPKVAIKCSADPNTFVGINQTAIENALKEMRRVNEIPEDRGFDINWFLLGDTDMTELDFAPFYGSHFDEITFVRNLFLTKLVLSGNASDYGSIHAKSLALAWSPLSRERFGDVLKYFSNVMTELSAWHIGIEENEPNTEFLPGMSSLTNLAILDLALSNIGRLNSGAFKGLSRLEYVNVGSNNLNYIGENVFDFEINDSDADDADSVSVADYVDYDVEIYLGLNDLNETSFHPNCGIANRSGRTFVLKLIQNQITTLPTTFFQAFLEGHPLNRLQFEDNPLICDERVSWLKARRDEFESRVFGDCSNDFFTSIFDSDLVP